MSSSRSRSASPKRNTEVLSDEDYVKQIKDYNIGGLKRYWRESETLYVIIQGPTPDMYDENSQLYSAVLNRLQAIALTCLCTSQRQFSLRGQRQTKRIAQLLFAYILWHDNDERLTYEEKFPTEIEWFKSLFPEEDEPWKTLFWRNEMYGHNKFDGYLHPMPIILRSKFYKLD